MFLRCTCYEQWLNPTQHNTDTTIDNIWISYFKLSKLPYLFCGKQTKFNRHSFLCSLCLLINSHSTSCGFFWHGTLLSLWHFNRVFFSMVFNTWSIDLNNGAFILKQCHKLKCHSKWYTIDVRMGYFWWLFLGW